MLLFKYPMMKRSLLKYKDEITQEQAEAKEANPDAEALDDDDIDVHSYNRLMEQGVGGSDPSDTLCKDYSEEEIKNDRTAVDWESA